MSDNLMRENRLKMRNSYGVKVGTGIENHYYMSYLSATLQALFACEEFRVKLILFAEEYEPQDIPNTRFHTHIADLYKHMVIGKEAFVIPGLKILTTQLKRPIIKCQEVNPKYFIDNLMESLDSLYHNYMNTKPTQATLDKCPTESFIGEKLFRDQIHWTTTINSGGKVRVGEQPQQSLIEDEVNRQCGSDSATSVWQLPSILILALEPEKNDIAIQYTITVDSQTYSLFAYVCKPKVNHYDCCTKFGEQWTYFDGKIAKQITKQVFKVTKVCLMFYQRSESAHIRQYCKFVDGLIGSSEVSDANLIQPQSAFRPIRDTTEISVATALFTWNLGFSNVVEICYFNTTLQSLYACRLFRKYLMECDQNIGPFHRAFKHLFLSMREMDEYDTRNFHNQFYQLYRRVHHLNTTLHCFQVILVVLHTEYINFGSNDRIEARFGVDEELVDEKNYNEIFGGREDLGSNRSWNGHVIGEHNSYITNLFTKQYISSERCNIGHKSKIEFGYEYYQFIPQDVYEYANSLQKIVYLLSTCRDNTENNMRCDTCPTGSNEWYEYHESMSRVNNILAFRFDGKPFETIDEWNSFGKTGVHLNEYLVICGQTYRCMAWTVAEVSDFEETGHAYAYCRSDDGYWYLINDAFISNSLFKMPQESDIEEEKSMIDMAFYERVFDAQQSDSDSDSITSRLRSISDLTEVRPIDSGGQSRPRSGSQFIGDQPMREAIVGFTNSRGFRSYMNSVIQCLYHCSKFRNYIMHEQRTIEIIGEEPVIANTHQTMKRLFGNISSNNMQTIDATDTWFFTRFADKHPEYARDVGYDPQDFLWHIITDLLAEDNRLPDNADSMESEHILNEEMNLYWSDYLQSRIVQMFYVITQYNIFCFQTETHFKISTDSGIKLEIPIPNARPHARQIHSVRSLVNAYLLHSTPVTIECEDCNQANQRQRENPNPNGNANVAQKLKYIWRTPDILVIQFYSINPDIWQLFETASHIDVDKQLIVCEQNYIFRACICCDVVTPDYYVSNYVPQYRFYVYTSVDHAVYCIDDNAIMLLSQPQPQPSTVLPQLTNVYMVFYEKN